MIRNCRTALSILAVLLGSSLAIAEPVTAQSGIDEHTVALWLFDETSYPAAILTDSSPYHHDLRLECGYSKWWNRVGGEGNPDKGKPDKDEAPLHLTGSGGLVKGKFGNALQLPAGDSGQVKWPEEQHLRYGSHFKFSRGDAVPERLNLGYLDWTIEFWFRATGPQENTPSLIEMRNETSNSRVIPMVNALMIAPGRKHFMLVSIITRPNPRYPINTRIDIPTDTDKLNDGKWHHLAFTYNADERQLRHYVDGRVQQLPDKGGFLPMMGKLVSFQFDNQVVGMLDEMRISDVVRYREDFTPPGSFSQNYAVKPREVNKPDGPPLLFGPNQKYRKVIPLGSSKHLFIDDALIDQMDNIRFSVNPPITRQVTGFRNDKPWEPTPRFGSTIPDICSFWDEGDEIRMLYTNGGMWGGKPHVTCLAVSADGLNWKKPALGLREWEGSTQNNIVIRDSAQGSVVKDPNPLVALEHRYKYAAWCMYWGFYVFTSPDGIHWRRNETVALPFDPDGSISFYWDDQQGIYQGYIRSLMSTGFRRQTGHVKIPEILKPWPFKQIDYPDMADMSLAKPVSGEVPILDTGGEVYRFKAHKYQWAPDVYLAFPWRYMSADNVRPGSFLMVSRDGEHWKGYEDPFYFPSDWKLDGREVLEALMEHGMIRRGDDVWQFGTVRFTEHGGVLYGGVENDGGIHDRLLRLVQRLDGFVSLGADDNAGTATTKPLMFKGKELQLNIDAKGSARVALLNEAGEAIKGFSIEDCDPVTSDNVRHTVTWNGKSDISSAAGMTVRLKFELKQAKLYAMQFVASN